MNKLFIKTSALAATVAFFGALASPAMALTHSLRTFDAAAGSCQGALPNFEGSLRKRPLAVANEGTTTAFVTCGIHIPSIFSVGGATNPGMDHAWVGFRNRSGADVTVNCSLVESNGDGTAQASIAKSITVAAGGFTEAQWDGTADHAGTNFRLPAFSCALPPATDITHIIYNYTMDVGS